MALRDLDRVAERAGVLDLEAFDAGALPLPLFECGEPRARVGAQRDALRKLGIGLGPHDAAVADLRRRLVDERAFEIAPQFGEVLDAVEQWFDRGDRRTAQRSDHLERSPQ